MFAYLMGLKTISPKALQQLRQDARPVTIIDVNSRQSWVSAHVPGALHLDSVAYTEADLPTDTDAMLVFYCSNPMCMKAPTAARRARKMHYANAHVMPAGISGWIAAALPTESAR
jgi:rhodanese-related sulfurtransferase